MSFHIIFLNSDFSVDIAAIFSKSLGNVLYSLLEGTVSQHFDIDPGLIFILYRNVNYFFTNIYGYYNKNVTRA